MEYQNPASQRALDRSQSNLPSGPSHPVTFPESYPFAMLAFLPKNPATTSASTTSALSEKRPDFVPGLGEVAIVFLVLVLAAPKRHLLGFLESMFEIEGPDNFSAFLFKCFKVAISIINNDAFPKNWLNVNVLAHKFLIKLMDPIATLLEREFVPHGQSTSEFHPTLWREAFHILLRILSSEHLVIEEFIPQVSTHAHEQCVILNYTPETSRSLAPCWRHPR